MGQVPQFSNMRGVHDAAIWVVNGKRIRGVRLLLTTGSVVVPKWAMLPVSTMIEKGGEPSEEFKLEETC
jgi:hypothetical protein